MNANKIFKDKKWLIWSIPTTILLVYITLYIHHFEFRDAVLEVHFFGLERNRAIFIESSDGHTFLVGAGDKSVIRSLTKVIPFYERKIDYVFVPSVVPSQIAGLIDVLKRYEVKEIVIPKILGTSTALTQLNKIIKKNKIIVKSVERGDMFGIGDLNIKILFPYETFKFNKTSLPELGIVFEYFNTGLYLMGNLSKTIQKDISKNLVINTSENILELFNSAGRTKLSEEFLGNISPKYIHSTKTKPTKWVSNGEVWMNGD